MLKMTRQGAQNNPPPTLQRVFVDETKGNFGPWLSNGSPAVVLNGNPAPAATEPIKNARASINSGDEARTEAVEAANTSFREGKYQLAASEYADIASSEPEARLPEGISYYMLKDFARARPVLEDYLKDGSNKAQAAKALAYICYNTDDLDCALQYAGTSLSIKPDPELSSLKDRLEAEKQARGSAIREDSGHFSVIFDGYAQGATSRAVLGILEDAYAEIGYKLNSYPPEPVTVILYGAKDFSEVNRTPIWCGGLYDGKIRLPVRGAQPDKNELKHVLYHEYTHAVVKDMAGDHCPVWFNEGLAEYLSRTPAAPIGQTLSLESLEQPFSQLQENSVSTAYLESYSAVRYLAETYGLYSITQFLEGLGAGKSTAQAFEDAFYMKYSDFISTWGKTS